MGHLPMEQNNLGPSTTPNVRSRAELPGEERLVQSIFNEMADEYDNLRDLWYSHTFRFIDRVLREEFALTKAPTTKPVALDIGCGTGIQSLRLATLGYKVIGVDIAERLLDVARRKLLEQGYLDAQFHLLDAVSLPFESGSADCVNCCGPTLSFIPSWRQALAEMSRCLRPGGRLLLEVEGRWNPDLFWEMLSAVTFDALHYGTSLRTALGHLAPPWHVGYSIRYPFQRESGVRVDMPLRLFTGSEISREALGVNLVPRKRWGLHSLTNLIPSTVLHSADPSTAVRKVFEPLASLERRINHRWPINAFACSLLVLAVKQESE